MPEDQVRISRVTRSRDEARASYNRMSKWYDAIAGHSEQRYVQAGLQRLAAQAGERILEIGFGTGHAILALAQLVTRSGKVYGLDISEGMLDVTEKRVRQAGLSDRVELRRGDATQLPFEDGFFDAVFMSFTLELFDTAEIPTVLQECKRVSRSGGRLAVVAMSKQSAGGFAGQGKPGLMLRLYEWAHEQFPAYVDCRPIFVQEALQDIGLRIVYAAAMSMWGLPVEVVLSLKNGYPLEDQDV
jgi:ubiquinone/menaquinone biosynthesis C-methylase UbiE